MLASARGASVCPRTGKEGRGLARRSFKGSRASEFCLLWLLGRKAISAPKHRWDKRPKPGEMAGLYMRKEAGDESKGVKAFLVSLEVDA